MWVKQWADHFLPTTHGSLVSIVVGPAVGSAVGSVGGPLVPAVGSVSTEIILLSYKYTIIILFANMWVKQWADHFLPRTHGSLVSIVVGSAVGSAGGPLVPAVGSLSTEIILLSYKYTICHFFKMWVKQWADHLLPTTHGSLVSIVGGGPFIPAAGGPLVPAVGDTVVDSGGREGNYDDIIIKVYNVWFFNMRGLWS